MRQNPHVPDLWGARVSNDPGLHDRGPWPETVAVLAGGMTTVAPSAVAVS